MGAARAALLTIATASLSACVLVPTGPRLQQFVFAGHGGVVVTYAYGPPCTVIVAGQTLRLSRQRQPAGTLFDNADALLVNGRPYLSLTPYQGRLPTFQLVRDPFTGRQAVRDSGRIDELVIYDGQRWSSAALAPANLFGERVVRPTPRETLRGWGGLSDAESDLVQRFLESHRTEVAAAIFPDGLATDLPEMDPRPASRNRIRVEYVLGVAASPIMEEPVHATLRQLAFGSQSAAHSAQVLIARDRDTLERIRDLAYGHLIGGPRPAWEVDLADGPVVGVFLGMRPTGGFAVVIDAALPIPGGVLLRPREVRPAPDAMVTMALTFPWTVVQVVTRDPLTPVTVR